MKRITLFAILLYCTNIMAQEVFVMGVKVEQDFYSFSKAITPKLHDIRRNEPFCIEGYCTFAGYHNCSFKAFAFSDYCRGTVQEVSVGIAPGHDELDKTLQLVLKSIQSRYNVNYKVMNKSEKLPTEGHSTWFGDTTYVFQKGNITITAHIHALMVWVAYYVGCHHEFNPSDF